MADGLDADTQTKNAKPDNGVVPSRSSAGSGVWMTLALLGLVAASAAVAVVLVRSAWRRQPPSDPTSERIQSLIDEANRLLKRLDEEKGG